LWSSVFSADRLFYFCDGSNIRVYYIRDQQRLPWCRVASEGWVPHWKYMCDSSWFKLVISRCIWLVIALIWSKNGPDECALKIHYMCIVNFVQRTQKVGTVCHFIHIPLLHTLFSVSDLKRQQFDLHDNEVKICCLFLDICNCV
jgi:hypothetical protein